MSSIGLQSGYVVFAHKFLCNLWPHIVMSFGMENKCADTTFNGFFVLVTRNTWCVFPEPVSLCPIRVTNGRTHWHLRICTRRPISVITYYSQNFVPQNHTLARTCGLCVKNNISIWILPKFGVEDKDCETAFFANRRQKSQFYSFTPKPGERESRPELSRDKSLNLSAKWRCQLAIHQYSTVPYILTL